MKVGGKDKTKDLYRRHWERFAEEIGISFPLVRSTLQSMHTAIEAVIQRKKATCDHGIERETLACIEAHAARVIQQFQVQIDQAGRA